MQLPGVELKAPAGRKHFLWKMAFHYLTRDPKFAMETVCQVNTILLPCKHDIKHISSNYKHIYVFHKVLY